MTREELKEALSQAGSTFDGHVTNGSIEAQMQVIEECFRLFESKEAAAAGVQSAYESAEEDGYGFGV
jgi:hypothetical protein